MGNTISFVPNRIKSIQTDIMEEQIKQNDKLRSIQAALQTAMVRDQLQWGCGLYFFFVAGASAHYLKHKSASPALIAPLFLGGFVISYMTDMAYGNKMTRVRQEAEHILISERYRLVPSLQSPSRKLWEEEAKQLELSKIPRVGKIWAMNLQQAKHHSGESV